jgi:Tol biopolymer transport system component
VLHDMRKTPWYDEAEALFASLLKPGTGQIIDAVELCACPQRKRVVFSGTLVDRLEGTPPTRICQLDLETTDLRVLTFGPNTDRLPKYSPDGSHIAFLSDRARRGDFQLYLLNVAQGVVRSAAHVSGWIESLQWSPDGTRVLLGVAGHGANVSGGQGAIATERLHGALAPWMPAVDVGHADFQWRRLWIFDLHTGDVRQVEHTGPNVWEASWWGVDALVAVASPNPTEGAWYRASLMRIEVATGATREIYRPKHQIGLPCASSSGNHVAASVATVETSLANCVCLMKTRGSSRALRLTALT